MPFFFFFFLFSSEIRVRELPERRADPGDAALHKEEVVDVAPVVDVLSAQARERDREGREGRSNDDDVLVTCSWHDDRKKTSFQTQSSHK